MWQFLAIKQNWIIQLAICHIWYIPTTLLWFLNQWWQFVVTFWGYNDHHMRIWGSYIFRDCPIIPGQFDDYSHMRVWGYEDPHMRIWIIMVQNVQGLPPHTRTIWWFDLMIILIYEDMRILIWGYEDMMIPIWGYKVPRFKTFRACPIMQGLRCPDVLYLL